MASVRPRLSLSQSSAPFTPGRSSYDSAESASCCSSITSDAASSPPVSSSQQRVMKPTLGHVTRRSLQLDGTGCAKTADPVLTNLGGQKLVTERVSYMLGPLLGSSLQHRHEQIQACPQELLTVALLCGVCAGSAVGTDCWHGAPNTHSNPTHTHRPRRRPCYQTRTPAATLGPRCTHRSAPHIQYLYTPPVP